MLTRRTFLASLGFTALILGATTSSAFAETYQQRDSQEINRAHCRLPGVYIGTIPGQTTFIMSIIPLEPSARHVKLVIDTTGDADPTSGGLYPDAIGQSNPRGVATRESAKSYTGQLVRYRYDSSLAVIGTELQVAAIEQTDCNTLAVDFVGLSFYFSFINPGDTKLPTPDIDVDVSEFPTIEAKKMLPYELNKPDA